MAGSNSDDIENLPSSSSTSRDEDESRRSNLNDTPDLGIGLNNVPEPNLRKEQPRHEKREDNPFSFKKFLNQDCGTRRKDYVMEGVPVSPHNPEMSSILPDFVQDHLVVEQSYLSSPSHHGPLPFDLPNLSEDRHDPSHGMILPDFLSDGPIHSKRSDGENAEYVSDPEFSISNGHVLSPSSSTRNEIDGLQREIDYLRRQLHDKNRKVNILESEIALLHSRDARETNSLEYALVKAENNLRQSSQRMIDAESKVLKLKNENKILRTRLESMEGNQGASTFSSYSSDLVRTRNQRLAQDLRKAASAAQAHLKSLSSGIDNLKMLADTIEDDSSFTDYEDSGATASGPAL